jgi:hypothetical protein
MSQLEYLSEWADDSVNYHRYKTGAGFYKLVLDMFGIFDDNLVFIEEDTLNTDQIVSSFNSMRDYLTNFAYTNMMDSVIIFEFDSMAMYYQQTFDSSLLKEIEMKATYDILSYGYGWGAMFFLDEVYFKFEISAIKHKGELLIFMANGGILEDKFEEKMIDCVLYDPVVNDSMIISLKYNSGYFIADSIPISWQNPRIKGFYLFGVKGRYDKTHSFDIPVTILD